MLQQAAVAVAVVAVSVLVGAGAADGATQTGLEAFIASNYTAVRGCRTVGIMTNPTGVLPSFQHEVDYFMADPAISSRIQAVFGPGTRPQPPPGSAPPPAASRRRLTRTAPHTQSTASAARCRRASPENRAFLAPRRPHPLLTPPALPHRYVDPQTNLTVWTTYGRSGEKLAALFARSGIDCLLVDLQDVGARFYTYIWSMYDSMVAAALAGSVRRVVVLDRPNPARADRVSGPLVDPGFFSFVGCAPIAMRHGMTIGELARLFQQNYIGPALPPHVRPVPLIVVPMVQYNRSMSFADTGAPWVPPSPNMPTIETAAVYPGAGLWEGTNAATRGSTTPFQTIGAPFWDWRFAVALRRRAQSGASAALWAKLRVREAFFTPTFDKYEGTLCPAFQLEVVDARTADPIAASLDAMATALHMYPGNMTLTPYLDLLTGSNTTRLALLRGATAESIVAEYRRDLLPFLPLREAALLYK